MAKVKSVTVANGAMFTELTTNITALVLALKVRRDAISTYAGLKSKIQSALDADSTLADRLIDHFGKDSEEARLIRRMVKPKVERKPNFGKLLASISNDELVKLCQARGMVVTIPKGKVK